MLRKGKEEGKGTGCVTSLPALVQLTAWADGRVLSLVSYTLLVGTLLLTQMVFIQWPGAKSARRVWQRHLGSLMGGF